MSKKKTIAVAIVLALILIIGGILAYFTDSDTEVNNFTIGDPVNICLNEVFDPQDAEDIHPGATVGKEPYVMNESATTPAYVFAEVIVPCYEKTSGTYEPLYSLNTIGAGWTRIDNNSADATSKTITYVYVWGTAATPTALAANASTTTPVFASVTLDPDLEATHTVTDANIEVNAYGIQTDNLGNINSAAIYALANP